MKGIIIVCEYSLIHETKKVLKYWKKTNIYLIIIKPCLSTFNPAKKLSYLPNKNKSDE